MCVFVCAMYIYFLYNYDVVLWVLCSVIPVVQLPLIYSVTPVIPRNVLISRPMIHVPKLGLLFSESHGGLTCDCGVE